VPTSSAVAANPTDHPERPVNEKPSGTTDDEVSATQTSVPSESDTETDNGPPHSSWLPSFFPTFGVSAKTQIWIYGSLALIVTFCSGLGVYFYLARRKRLRNNPRDDYEFELLNEEEAEGLTQGEEMGMSGRGAGKGKRRAGELYDAFAAGSEDESGDEADGEYRDQRGGAAKHVIGDDDDEGSDGGMSGGDEKAAERSRLQG
jgi:kexin